MGGAGNKKRSTVFCSWPCRSSAKYNANGQTSREMPPTEAAYFAGIIDGEGHISIYGGYGKKDPHAYRAHLGVANTDLGLLEWLKTASGVGGVSLQRKASDNRKAAYQWQIGAEGARSVLVQVLPYLVIKADRARLVIDFQTRLRQPALKADRTWQHEAVAAVRALNARGPATE